jgi:hypothetical protein
VDWKVTIILLVSWPLIMIGGRWLYVKLGGKPKRGW